MNEIVSNFIEKKKQDSLNEANRKKNEHLVKLGLVDKQKIIPSKEYFHGMASEPYLKNNGYYQDEQGWYKMVNNYAPLEVTDEEYAEICKVCPPEKTTEKAVIVNNFAEKAVTVCAWAFLAVGVISSIVFMALAGESYPFDWIMFFIGVGVLLSSLMTSALALVLVNISNKISILKNNLS